MRNARFNQEEHSMLRSIASLALFGAVAMSSAAMAQTPATTSAKETTVVLVHGAFAESFSWNGVVTRLLAQGYQVVTVANPLRGVKSDTVKGFSRKIHCSRSKIAASLISLADQHIYRIHHPSHGQGANRSGFWILGDALRRLALN
jgi:pimeloyl-ACP methyl ester carboxylesterase